KGVAGPGGGVGAQDRTDDARERLPKKSLAAAGGTTAAGQRRWRRTLYQKIEEVVAAASELSVRGMCGAAQVSRASYYRFVGSVAEDPDMELRSVVQKIALSRPSYGYRRVQAELERRGHQVNHKRVRRIMREDNLLCLRRRSFVRTTDSKHGFMVYANLARGLVLTDINQLWVADITYIRLRSEFVYLAVILDAFSRRVIGWELGHTLAAELALGALRKALKGRSFAPGLVHHSDRGVQYASGDYTELLCKPQIHISLIRRGNPSANAQA